MTCLHRGQFGSDHGNHLKLNYCKLLLISSNYFLCLHFNLEYYFQCSVSVSDQGYPEVNIDEAQVRISVQRDIALPKFDQSSYRRDVSESVAVNTSVAQVNARMEGINVSIHIIV